MKKILASVSLLALPAIAFGQTFDDSYFTDIIDFLTRAVNQLIPFAIGLAVLFFIFGLISFITAGADEEKRAGARNTMIWGIIILFVMVSVWGLVGLLQNITGVDGDVRAPEAPAVPREGNN